MKTAKKHISILCFALCFVVLLASCNQLTMNGADANKASEDVSSKEITEENSKAEESKTDISMTEESKAEEGKMDEEPPEEPDYVVEMSEEMLNEYLAFSGRNCTLEELIEAVTKEGLSEDWVTEYNDAYDAYGNLNGYTFCHINPGIAHWGCQFAGGDYITKDYKYQFMDTVTGGKSQVNLYLYKDHTFITFEDACEQGLIDPAEAYELMQNKDFGDKDVPVCASVKELTEEEANWYKELRKNAAEMYKK